MAPKKAAKPVTTAPSRRSARIASREPSQEPSQEPAPSRATSVASDTSKTSKTVDKTISKKVVKKNEVTKWKAPAIEAIHAIASEERYARSLSSQRAGSAPWLNKYLPTLTPAQIKAIMIGFAGQVNDLEDEVQDLQAEKESIEAERNAAMESRPRSIRRDGLLARIYSSYEKKQEVAAAASPPQQQLENAMEFSTTAPLAIIEEREQSPDAPAATISSAPSPLDEQPESSMESAALAPPPVAEERGQPAAQAASGWRRMLSTVGGYMSPLVLKRPAADDAITQPSQKRARVEDAENAPSPAPPTTPPPAPILEEEVADAATPLPSQKRKRAEEKETPRSSRVLFSTKNPLRETSLSTITELSEPFSVSTLSMGPPQAESTPVGPFIVRRAAQLRAARSAGLTTPTPHQYAWERQVSTPRPKEPNADVRLAKLQRMRDLQRELSELEQDADIKDMEAQSVHKRKRVKIDHLAVIPHNRPGDSTSTFRVPDIDSDDEMEVDDSITERSNIFEDIQKMDTATQTVQQDVPTFTFPDVGPKPAEYHVTEQYKEEAGSLFGQGLKEYLGVV